MFNFIVDHALANVWCTPDQDQQAIVKPARLTPDNGVWNWVDVLWRRYKLPEQGVRFHVYQIGQLHPLLMGLFPVGEKWVTFAKACNNQNLIVDIYANSGVQFPRFECWYMVTNDKNLIVAVKEQSKIPVNLNTEDVYVRVYSNAYYNSERSSPEDDFVKVVGVRASRQLDILNIQQQYETHRALPGQTYAFINGYKVGAIGLATAKVGDLIEFVYDSSIKSVIDFKVSDLPTFDSLLDNKRKYLLHYPGWGDGTIDFHDDIDVFLIKAGTGGHHKGVYYHRNMADAMRMITHKDYSVCVPYLAGYVEDNPEWTDLRDLYVRLHVRKSGYQRAIVNEHNRIKELYKLQDLDLRKALLGVDSVLDNWRADFLENSDYSRIMRVSSDDITEPLVRSAYGYNAISKLVGDTPSKTRVNSTLKVIDVPYNLQANSTAYEYDSDGKLLGWYIHPSGSIYGARNQNAAHVEMISGVGGEDCEEYYGTGEVTINPLNNYRFYICGVNNNQPDYEWVDVTGQPKYDIVGNKVVWFIDPMTHYGLVRGDGKFLAYGFNTSIANGDGIIRFSLSQFQTHYGNRSKFLMSLPMGELDVFLNGRSLIEGLDYFVKFPELLIVNKEYLINPMEQAQEIAIRFTGFCKKDLTREIPDDIGFVKFGQLSHNSRFDIRDDKVMRFVVDGRMKDRDSLSFAEDSPVVTMEGVRNGAPYLIRDIVVPLRGLTVADTYEMRGESRAIDKAISDYMTLKLPQPPRENPNVIPERYQIYSPFCQKLLWDLKNGFLDNPKIYGHFSDMEVLEICRPYEYLLAYDPTQLDTAVDDRYVVIHPHNEFSVVDLGIYQHRFLSRAVTLYLNGKVNLSNFIRVEKF